MNEGNDAASRRGFLAAASSMGIGGLLAAGCAKTDPQANSASGGPRPLKAAFSNAGRQTTWCEQGYQTAMLWGKLLGVDITWVDGELAAQKQREKLDLIVDEPWDFCCFQAGQIDTLAEPARQLKARGVPIISMDTLLVPRDQLRDVGVWTQVAPNHEFMGETSARYLFEQLGGRGRVIHIGGDSAHSGAQGRAAGFERALADFPQIEVVGGGVRWCNWEKEKARNTFEGLLNQESQPIGAAFFHNDDMAIACADARRGTPHEKMLIAGVDGQKEGLAAIRDGKLNATTVNPTGLIHFTALAVGQFIVRNQEELEDVPLEIVTPGPLVSRETGNLEAMFYLSDPLHSLV
ncbi:MAG: sugar ABC transporter substrate-binding protein [Pirellulales bacterium]